MKESKREKESLWNLKINSDINEEGSKN